MGQKYTRIHTFSDDYSVCHKKTGGNIQGFTLFQIILELWSKAPLRRYTGHVRLVGLRLGLFC